MAGTKVSYPGRKPGKVVVVGKDGFVITAVKAGDTAALRKVAEQSK